jgi:NADH:ubiquinone oxidoreductase subunit F (NADH-binding)
MPLIERVLPGRPYTVLADYKAAGGGQGLDMARKLGPAGIIDEVEASGLRGRGGAGFPTGTKWRTVAAHEAAVPTTVVVNGAEGEPGSFKDRAIMRANPYSVVEGALIAALAVGADRAVVAIKETFTAERTALERVIAEIEQAGWAEGVALAVVTGPSDYLFGEETGLLEVLDGRPPFPRIAPPFRHGADEVGSDPAEPAGSVMADESPTGAPPALVNNVETVANVPGILAQGADWFRSVGTAESPGTVVCTISGRTRRHGVGEVAMGTPLSEVAELIGGGAREGQQLVAAVSGAANPLLPANQLDTPVSYEAMAAAGSGLGAAGFVCFDDATDLAAVAAALSRFLAIESCGQCTPCKQDGLAIAVLLDKVRASEAEEEDLAAIADRVSTVADEARCYLAQQHQNVIDSVLRLFPGKLRVHLAEEPAAAPELILPIVDIVDGQAVLDLDHLTKQPDWSHDKIDSGKAPVDRLAVAATAEDRGEA